MTIITWMVDAMNLIKVHGEKHIATPNMQWAILEEDYVAAYQISIPKELLDTTLKALLILGKKGGITLYTFIIFQLMKMQNLESKILCSG
mmetsp:Transcript_2298/g.3358  ORF Transcript_2298/g.3358 Transcript_2298/m.3358 type:complete len:90 (-) Transcript_2298:908-1177(-)